MQLLRGWGVAADDAERWLTDRAEDGRDRASAGVDLVASGCLEPAAECARCGECGHLSGAGAEPAMQGHLKPDTGRRHVGISSGD
jgi:hypothetical protein